VKNKPDAKSGDTHMAFCSRCGCPRRFIFTESIKQVVLTGKNKKRVIEKLTSNNKTTRALDSAAQRKGVGIAKKDWSHKNAKKAMTRVNQLSEKFERLWQLGLGES